MSDVSWATFFKWCVISVAVLALFVGIIYGMVKIEKSVSPDYAATERAITHACDPLANRSVDYHGPGWSTGGRYEITCSDGSQQIVYPR